MELCEIIIKWCKELRFEFLQYRIEFKLIQVMINFKQFDKAYSSISTLISYVQKSEDKLLLLDLYLTQCSLGIGINNVSQAVSFLTNAKTVASSINTPLELQFKIELLSGILQADVSDYRTAVPYLQEAFDIAESLNNIENGTQALMYMLLCFMLSDDVDNLARIMKSNFCLKLVDDSRIKGMLNLINAYMSKDINKYREVIQDPNFSLKDEQTIVYHLEKNYESVVDNSIMDIVYAYSHLQLNFIAQKISLPVSVVSTQLEKMIIDGKINGILDESLGVLIQYKATVESEEIYKSNQICENLSQVANKLLKYCDLLK
uniref:26S proteasome non-ATPase regulatory subunit 11-like n=1 Tax=Dermatophagoides pteronyssinus TaxID=6956 RepID=A0A6P6XK29_DERPT|nr:26S proteasome non-ATPase regulatory subunit 11-like [Dermatophagoides pteronyssinus]